MGGQGLLELVSCLFALDLLCRDMLAVLYCMIDGSTMSLPVMTVWCSVSTQAVLLDLGGGSPEKGCSCAASPYWEAGWTPVRSVVLA